MAEALSVKPYAPYLFLKEHNYIKKRYPVESGQNDLLAFFRQKANRGEFDIMRSTFI